jgi:hypothetical protein
LATCQFGNGFTGEIGNDAGRSSRVILALFNDACDGSSLNDKTRSLRIETAKTTVRLDALDQEFREFVFPMLDGM